MAELRQVPRVFAVLTERRVLESPLNAGLLHCRRLGVPVTARGVALPVPS